MITGGEGACGSSARDTEEEPTRLCGGLPGRRDAGKTSRAKKSQGEHTHTRGQVNNEENT